MLFKIIMWILRLLSWPWAARESIERWPAVLQENCRPTTAGLKAVEPRVTGTRMDYTANNQVDARRSSGILLRTDAHITC